MKRYLHAYTSSILISVLLFLSSASMVQNSQSIRKIGSYDTPGYAYGVDANGNFAYVADGGSGLHILDISNPSAPSLMDSYDTPGGANRVAVVGDYAYVADVSSLQIIDISTPGSASFTGSIATPGNAYDVTVKGTFAYVADGTAGLQVVDVSVPTTPSLRGSYNTPDEAVAVCVVNNYAYVADNSTGLLVIDVSDPDALVPKGTYNTPGLAEDVRVAGSYAYVADRGKGLQIIDVSNPDTLTLTGNYNTPSDTASGVKVKGDLAYVVGYSVGLLVINVSNPSSPYVSAKYNTPDWAGDIDVSGDLAFVADGASGLFILRYEEGQVDLPPTMENINEKQNVCYNLAPCFSNFGFDDDIGLNDGWYKLDDGSWINLFPDCAGKSWNNNGWCIPDSLFHLLSDGAHTIYFMASDDEGNLGGETGEWNWSFYCDTTPPDDPTDVVSTSHTPGVWSTANTINVQWTDAVDVPEECGVEGYSVLWDSSETTIPDAIVTVPMGVQSTMSPQLPDGDSHYFHIRTRDRVGNWQNTVHLGPFFIDSTPPSVTVACQDTIRSTSDLCFTILGQDNFTPSEDVLISYFRVAVDRSFTDFEILDSLCYEYLWEGGPYTLWVRARDGAGNVGPVAECIFFFFPECGEALKGDIQYDCTLNILDAIRAVNIILDIPPDPSSHELWALDCNGPSGNCDGDGIHNIIDVIKIVNMVLGSDECP
jgi:hypothetical protein